MSQQTIPFYLACQGEGTQYYDEHDNLMIEKENEGMNT